MTTKIIDEQGFSDGIVYGNPLPAKVPGRFNKAFSFNGATHVEVENNLINNLDFSISFWVDTEDTNCGLFSDGCNSSGGSDRGFDIKILSSGDLQARVRGDSGFQETLVAPGFSPTSGFKHISVVYSRTAKFELYVNGILLDSVVPSASIFNIISALATARVGAGNSDGNVADVFTGNLDQLRFYSGSLTASEVLALYNEAIPTIPTDPISYYTGDNISGSTLVDEEGNHNGTIIGSVVAGSSLPTQVGDYLEFPGSGSFVDLNTLLNGTITEISFSALINTQLGSTGAIFNLLEHITDNGSSSDVIELRTSSSGEVSIKVRGISNTNYNTTQNQVLPIDSMWHHLVFTLGSSSIKVYVDGVLRIDTPSPNEDFLINFASLGARPDNSANFAGKMDQVRFFNRELTPTEVYSLTCELLPSCTETLPLDYVHHYTMDNISGSTLVDETGNQDGTIFGSLTPVSPGKFGKALGGWNIGTVNIDGVLSGGVSGFSVSMWLKLNSNSGEDILLHLFSPDTFKIKISGFDLSVQIAGGAPNGTFVGAGGDRLQDYNDRWKHVVVSVGTNSLKAYIDNYLVLNTTISPHTWSFAQGSLGRDLFTSSTRIDGSIDQVRIYDRELTTAEVSGLYCDPGNGLVPEADIFYTMDNISGSTLVDEQGNADGILVGGPLQTTGNTGKFNEALIFDGSDDYVNIVPTVADPTELSLSVWANLSQVGLVNIFSHADSSGSFAPAIAFRIFSGNFEFIIRSTDDASPLVIGGGTPVITSPNYTHLVFIFRKSGNCEIWVDGTQVFTQAVNITGSLTSSRAILGAASVNAYPSSPIQFTSQTLDQARLYDRALTPTEIGLLYNE